MALRVHRAALRGDVAELEALLDAEPVLVNGRGERNTTPLMAAAAGGQVEVVRVLLRRGADVALLADESISALMVACIEGQGEVLALLLQAGADANAQGARGLSALVYASGEGHSDVVATLLAMPDVSYEQRCLALLMACRSGHVDIARSLLVEGGANHVLAIRDLRQRVALGMEVNLHIIDLLEWFVEGDLRSYTLHMARAVAEHQQSNPHTPLGPPPPPPQKVRANKAKETGPILLRLPWACLQLRRCRADELGTSRHEAAEQVAGALHLHPLMEAKAKGVCAVRAPSYLERRLEHGRVLPSVAIVPPHVPTLAQRLLGRVKDLLGLDRRTRRRLKRRREDRARGQRKVEEEERQAVIRFVVQELNADLYTDMMEGLRLR